MIPDLARALLGLVLPVQCAGCDADDVAWCPRCALLLAGPPGRCEQRAGRLDRLDGCPPLPVWALADCVGPVRRAVVAWKDRGRRDLTVALRTALADGARVLARDAPELVDGPALVGGPLLVVPVPSTAAARRRRGEDLVGELARGVAAGLVGVGVEARAVPVLLRRRGGDQVGLGVRERARNLHGQVRVRSHRLAEVGGARVLIVDDVLTTGATLAACEAALTSAGARVLGALALASTPAPGVVRTLATPREPVAGRVRSGPGADADWILRDRRG